MKRFLFLLLGTMVPPLATAAELVSAAPEAVEVVIYRDQFISTENLYNPGTRLDGLAMITETRTVDIPQGVSTIKFVGTSEAIIPQTAKIDGMPAAIVESNFNYDLIAPGELIAKSIGKSVTLMRTDKKTGKTIERRAILRSGPAGILLDIGGEIEALNCSKLNEKIVFDDIPPTLTDKPTLSVTVRASEAGHYQLRLRYLVLGLDWSADYVARIHADGQAMDLLAWVTLANGLSTTFNDAPVQVVAGNLSRVEDETVAPEIARLSMSNQCWPIGSFITYKTTVMQDAPRIAVAAPIAMSALEEIAVSAAKKAELSELGDYKLYTLPERTTVAAQQIKQVRLLEQANVRFARIYTYFLDTNSLPDGKLLQASTITLRLDNKEENGLGLPLPSGTLSAYETDGNGGLHLAGESRLLDIPVGSPVDLAIGQATDVWVNPRVVSDTHDKHSGTPFRRLEIVIEVGNDKSIPVNVEFNHSVDEDSASHLISESKRHVISRGNLQWSFKLKPGEREELHYTIEQAN